MLCQAKCLNKGIFIQHPMVKNIKLHWNSKISLNESEGFYFYSIGVQYTIYFLEECFFQVLCSYETENLAHMSDKYDGTD